MRLPRRISIRWLALVAGILLGIGTLVALGVGDTSQAVAQSAGSEAAGGSEGNAADAAQNEAARRRVLLSGFDPRVHHPQGEALVSDLGEGKTAVLTLHPGLQRHASDVLDRYEVPFASLVAVEPATGRVLSYVSHSSANPDASDLALDPTPPTASVFKIISAAALVDRGVRPEERVCYHGGFSRLRNADLADTARDNRCSTLAEAVGSSINTVFAKLSTRNLDTPTLERYAAAFGFGHALPFDVRTRPSPAEVPDHESDRLEFARTSAGFWHMHMSPLHGALVAATFANEGRMPRAAIVDHVTDAEGEVLLRHEPEIFRAVIPRHTARTVGQMMELTVTRGTARRTFHDGAGRPFLPGIRVAGKTGTLSGSDPYRGYTWWVGFAPADRPTIALAALVVNTPRWRIKASYLAREALRYYLVERPRREAALAAAAAEESLDTP